MIRIAGYPIDASLSETHTLSSEATEFPVESGADLTDHIRRLPIEVTIEGIVSNTPIGAVAAARATETAELGEELEVLPADEALARLERIYERRQPVTIQTELKLYERMAMTSLEIPRDRTTGRALMFTATFRQIKIVTNERTTIKTATPGGANKTKLGAKSATVVPSGATIVFTLRRVPIGATGGFTARNGKQYAFKPDWLTGDPGAVVASTSAGDHFTAGPLAIADGYVLAGRYTPYKRPIVLAAPGGATLQDESGRIWHSYPIQKPPADPSTPVQPDGGGEGITNAQYMQQVYGVTVPGGL